MSSQTFHQIRVFFYFEKIFLLVNILNIIFNFLCKKIKINFFTKKKKISKTKQKFFCENFQYNLKLGH